MKHIQTQLRTFQCRNVLNFITTPQHSYFDPIMELDPEYIITYYSKHVGNMKQSQQLAINIQQHCLDNNDTDLFFNSVRAMCFLKPYLTETSLSSNFVTKALANLSLFIDTMNAEKITYVLTFLTVFQDYLSPAQCNDIRILIIAILKNFSVSGLSKDCILSAGLLKLIIATVQQHQLEFLTQNQAVELAKYIAYNSSYLINSRLVATVLWEINQMYDIMDIVNETLSNSKYLAYIIQTLLELSKMFVQHGYLFQFSNKLTYTVQEMLIFNYNDSNLNINKTILLQTKMGSSIYIVSQVMSGVQIQKDILDCAIINIRKCECRTENESEFNNLCMTVLAQ
ncbi:Hypothetical_protein [Hexamita inflata]|uniref:Hypothetical_protein n=1 Tax=Hexamita inflata TaxID=28002 RepID=A0AA86VRL4_9EUKA|nr:Hypothetical protein HINF_LOCUS62328 [Hexamita inflata]